MPKNDELRYGPLTETCAHLCVDMQRLFGEGTDWETPWMGRVLPKVEQVVAAHPSRTIFTRFIPAERPGEGQGTWRRYYERWASMTIEQIGWDMVELMPSLARFVPPAEVIDKHVYSPWEETDLHQRLQRRGIDTLAISGGETDVCVLGTVLGAIDRGYRVVLLRDALCSSTDETHDASLHVYHRRYGVQVEPVTTDVLLANWLVPADAHA
ncbi:cysteine hydrolase family protein [Geminicoccus roseus]|uniref:cysteine hydrolase family protein n=1 Tax=Geminicoccus roseus TaxID=404900 RepID=UPI00040D621C|nr:isochorismatase family cysteine hydrolase [Geminicoccus roseus]